MDRKRLPDVQRPSHIAQICLNGHVVLHSLRDRPQWRKAYCEECGAKTIHTCQSCDWPIQGFGPDHWMAGRQYQTPKFCGRCGGAFPWTERALAAARDYTDDLEELNVEEKTSLKGTFDDLANDTPHTPVALSRFRRLLEKIAPAAGQGLLQIIVSVATDEVKRQLGLH
jgi:hypothetical protein